MVFLPHTNTVILLEPYCGTITEPGLPVRSYPTDITLSDRGFFSRAAEMLRGFGLNGDLTETGNPPMNNLWQPGYTYIGLFTDTATILNLLDLRSIMGCPGGTRSEFTRALRAKREL